VKKDVEGEGQVTSGAEKESALRNNVEEALEGSTDSVLLTKGKNQRPLEENDSVKNEREELPRSRNNILIMQGVGRGDLPATSGAGDDEGMGNKHSTNSMTTEAPNALPNDRDAPPNALISRSDLDPGISSKGRNLRSDDQECTSLSSLDREENNINMQSQVDETTIPRQKIVDETYNGLVNKASKIEGRNVRDQKQESGKLVDGVECSGEFGGRSAGGKIISSSSSTSTSAQQKEGTCVSPEMRPAVQKERPEETCEGDSSASCKLDQQNGNNECSLVTDPSNSTRKDSGVIDTELANSNKNDRDRKTGDKDSKTGDTSNTMMDDHKNNNDIAMLKNSNSMMANRNSNNTTMANSNNSNNTTMVNHNNNTATVNNGNNMTDDIMGTILKLRDQSNEKAAAEMMFNNRDPDLYHRSREQRYNLLYDQEQRCQSRDDGQVGNNNSNKYQQSSPRREDSSNHQNNPPGSEQKIIQHLVGGENYGRGLLSHPHPPMQMHPPMLSSSQGAGMMEDFHHRQCHPPLKMILPGADLSMSLQQSSQTQNGASANLRRGGEAERQRAEVEEQMRIIHNNIERCRQNIVRDRGALMREEEGGERLLLREDGRHSQLRRNRSDEDMKINRSNVLMTADTNYHQRMTADGTNHHLAGPNNRGGSSRSSPLLVSSMLPHPSSPRHSRSERGPHHGPPPSTTQSINNLSPNSISHQLSNGSQRFIFNSSNQDLINKSCHQFPQQYPPPTIQVEWDII